MLERVLYGTTIMIASIIELMSKAFQETAKILTVLEEVKIRLGQLLSVFLWNHRWGAKFLQGNKLMITIQRLHKYLLKRFLNIWKKWQGHLMLLSHRCFRALWVSILSQWMIKAQKVNQLFIPMAKVFKKWIFLR